MEEENIQVSRLTDALVKAQLNIGFLKRQNNEPGIRHIASQESPQKQESKYPPKPTTDEKGKQVINVEKVEEPKMKPRKPMTIASKPKLGWVEQMKQIAQSPDKLYFYQWRDYQRYLEELE